MNWARYTPVEFYPSPAAQAVGADASPRSAQVSGVESECDTCPKSGVTAGEHGTFLGAARRIAALRMDGGTQCPDCLPGGFELDGKVSRRSLSHLSWLRSLLFPRRNRYRLGRLGNALVRSGALRRVGA